MKIKIYHVDAFTDKVFSGNPAAVCPLENWPDDKTLHNIAVENNLAETAFFVKKGDGFHLRWFTPDIEMDLCGHATLAAAYVIKKHLHFSKKEIQFQSKSGLLTVLENKGLFTLNFPSRMPLAAPLPEIIKKGIDILPQQVLKSRDYFLVYKNEKEIRNIKLNKNILDQINLAPGGIIITAKGNEVDFVSRYFSTQATMFEDPVTGSAHCSLIPYWSRQLGKTELTAKQLSERGGDLKCRLKKDRVEISGHAVLYMKGEIVNPIQY